jgi:hypothetical protein
LRGSDRALLAGGAAAASASRSAEAFWLMGGALVLAPAAHRAEVYGHLYNPHHV